MIGGTDAHHPPFGNRTDGQHGMAGLRDGQADVGSTAQQVFDDFVDTAELDGEFQFRLVPDEFGNNPRQDPVPDGWRGDTAGQGSNPTDATAWVEGGGGGGGGEDTVPDEWSCPAGYFGSDDGCDCGCGVADPDCSGTTSDVCEYCNGSGSCAESCEEINSSDNTTCN